MRRLDVIRATASVATCEVRLSLWHAPSSADVSPLNIPTAASRKLPARRDLIDIFIGCRSRALIMRDPRRCRKVTQEGCSCVCGPWLVISYRYASRGVGHGASELHVERGSKICLAQRVYVHPVTQSVCRHVSSGHTVS